jgi:hypothetical protein
MFKKPWFLWIIVWLVISWACSFPMSSPATGGKALSINPTPPVPNQDKANLPSMAGGDSNQGGGGEIYPATPEAVIQEFLSAYTSDPAQMNQYLSEKYLAKASINPGAAAGLEGMLNGFAVQSAAVVPQVGEAVVVVGIVLDQKESQRKFHLIQQNGHWVVDQVDNP